MATTKPKTTSPRMSDDAVKAKTRKGWKEWFSVLDRAGGKKMSHQEIVKYLNTEQGIGPWWQQMVTVTYEQARGLRQLHQKPGGYEISVSRTIGVSIGKAFKSVANEKDRNGWLGKDGEGIVVHNATTNKTIRLTWHDKKTSLNISFYSKGDQKTQVVVQHSKLPDDQSASRMKTFWAKALERLRDSLPK